MRVVVVGAGVAGLGAALALGRDGHEVTLVERDATPMPRSADEAFGWDRRGAPQVRHSHALLARLRNLLRDRFPDVLADLLAVGATELRFTEMLPETLLDQTPRDGDEDLVALACRRTTFEWVLRRATLATSGVTLRDGVPVERLVFAPDRAPGEPPLVTGVHLADGEHLEADLVVVAQGRRSSLPTWLAAAGVTIDEHEEDTGIVYYSRFYRLLDGAEPPPKNGPIGGDLGYLKYAVFDGDNRTFSITLACEADDDELRRRFADPDGFTRSAAALVVTAPWLAEGVAEPITDVNVMARLLNRRRRYLSPGGDPLVLGVHAVGDAHTCTNPLYGRGCSLAMVQAVLLAEAVASAGGDAVARCVDYEAASAREVLPWYKAAVAQDRFNRQANHPDAPPVEALADDRSDGPDPTAGFSGDQLRDLMRDGLLPALRTDADVFRAFLRGFNLLQPPDVLMRDPHVLARVLAAYQDRDSRPPEPFLGPTDRASLLASIA